MTARPAVPEQPCKLCGRLASVIGHWPGCEVLRTKESSDKATKVTTARKDDEGKWRVDKLPWIALRSVADVMAFGAAKYEGWDQWQGVESARYVAAAMRHLVAHLGGEVNDPQSDLTHLSHAATSILFAVETEKKS